MRRYLYVLRVTATFTIVLGLFQAIADISWNQLWFTFLATILTALTGALFGADLSTLTA